MRPRIGLVSNFDRDRQIYFCYAAYVDAVVAAGGVPVVLPYLSSGEHIDQILSAVDGVILTGGPDVEPSYYGGRRDPSVQTPIPERDTFEIALARGIFAKDMPALGICRGLQVLNIAAGGSLYIDIPSAMPSAQAHWKELTEPAHFIRIDPESRLARMCAMTKACVNSQHHQAIRDLADTFRVSATAVDGIIEAIESVVHRCVIGVQWHPERIWDVEAASERLLKSFVDLCRERRGNVHQGDAQGSH